MKRPTQLLSNLEVTKLLALPDRASIKGSQDYCILALLFGCGLRRGEIARLAMGDIGTSRKKDLLTVTLRAPKGGKDATLPLPSWTASAVKTQKFLRESHGASSRDPLFVGFSGRGGIIPTTRPISVESIYTMFLRYSKLANLALGVAPHAARATAITTLLDRGFSHRDVKNFSRHSSIQMVEVYDKRRLEIEDNPALSLDYETKN
jgi:integrase